MAEDAVDRAPVAAHLNTLSGSTMSSSASSASSVAGLHGGNFSNFNRPQNHVVDVDQRGGGGAVMDDGRAYGNNGRTPSMMSSAARANKRSNPNNRNVLIIDLSEDSDGEDDATRKRSLQKNIHNCNGNNAIGSLSPNQPKRTRRPQNNHELMQSQGRRSHVNLPSRGTGDGATITFGILGLIDLLKDGNNTLTCEGSTTASRNKLFAPIHMPSSGQLSPALPFNHQPLHYLQKDNWSCGFRNLQMLLSSMMPTLSCIFPEGVPTIEEVQGTMEMLWSQGYDRRNALHHKHSLVGKKTWIGTVEVWSYLSFKRIDSIIIQFIKTTENRAMLGNFVWAYFNRICGSFGCSCNGNTNIQGNPLASPILNSTEYASHLIREITNPYYCNGNAGGGGEGGVRRCGCSLPPLYLQWEGHSVTIVGVRKINNAQGQPPSFNLIIFCPQKKQLCFHVKDMLTAELTRRHSNGGELSMDSRMCEKSVNSIIELSTNKLQHKDCQILLSTAHIIDEAESSLRKSCSKNVGYLDAVAPRKQA